MTNGPQAKAHPSLTSEEVNLRFLQLRAEFRKLGIDNPNPFIRWKKPELTEREEIKIRTGLSGRANSKSAYLLAVVEDVLQQMQAA